MYIYIYIYIGSHRSMHAAIYLYIYICIYTYIHTQNQYTYMTPASLAQSLLIYTCMYVFACVHTHICILTHMYTHTHVYSHTCILTHMYICSPRTVAAQEHEVLKPALHHEHDYKYKIYTQAGESWYDKYVHIYVQCMYVCVCMHDYKYIPAHD
jgi:hypothetical protein